MTFDEFWKKHVALVEPHGIEFEENCDLWTLVDGYIYYHNDEVIAHIKGVQYRRDGKGLTGDFSGYLDLLKCEIDKFAQEQNTTAKK